MFKNLFRRKHSHATVSGLTVSLTDCRELRYRIALREIAAMETAGANATVKRMAARARKELGE